MTDTMTIEDRLDEIASLHRSRPFCAWFYRMFFGWTYSRIAQKLGVTRQRAHQMVMGEVRKRIEAL